jgi:hypothetical protein
MRLLPGQWKGISMKTFKMVVELTTDYNLTEEEVPAFMKEQWEQTSAFMENDRIKISSVTEIK